MEALKELWNSVRLNLQDRVGNPLVGAFSLAWLIWNFRLSLIMFGEGNWKPKIDYIDKVLMPSWSDWLIHGYIVPLLFALVWVFALPVAFRRVMVFHRSQAAKTAKAVMLAEEQIPISNEEANKIRLRLRALSSEWEQERAIYLRQNEELSERIAMIQKSSSRPNAEAPIEQTENLSKPVSRGDSDTQEELRDPIVAFVGQLGKDENDKPRWPSRLGQGDLEQLPTSLANTVSGQSFDLLDIQALLAMRNWSTIDSTKLARALKVEKFDAQVVIDRLRDLALISSGSQGSYLNADGRMLTSYFKRVFSGSLAGSSGAEQDIA